MTKLRYLEYTSWKVLFGDLRPLLKLDEAQLPDDVTEGNSGKQTSFAESTKKLPKISQTGLTKTL